MPKEKVVNRDMSKTLFVTDLDGTLMHDNKEVSEFTVNTINKLIEKGVLITYATARSFKSSWEITKDINFKIPVITRNGTVFANQLERKETDISRFSTQEVNTLKLLLEGVIDRIGFVTAYFGDKMTKTYRNVELDSGFQKYVDEHADDKRMRPIEMNEDIFDGVVTYVTLIGEEEELKPIYDKVRNAEKWECVFQKDTYGEEFWLEICPQNATKAKAVLKCKELLGCEEVVVFGDSINDLSMFEVANEACAVDNAMDEVKRASTVVIPSNNEDGVAKYLRAAWME